MACQHPQCPNFTTDYHKNILYKDGRKKYIYNKKQIYIYIESVEKNIYNSHADQVQLQYVTTIIVTCTTIMKSTKVQTLGII